MCVCVCVRERERERERESRIWYSLTIKGCYAFKLNDLTLYVWAPRVV